jgi:hypothetical protein
MLKSQFEPCIPSRGTKVPDGAEWLHEIKHDGYRLIIQRDGKRVRLWRLGRLIGGSIDGKPDRDISLDQGNFSDEWTRANRAERFALLTRTGAHDLTSCDLICPNLEADQRVRPECVGDGNVRGITPLRDQDAANSRHVADRRYANGRRYRHRTSQQNRPPPKALVCRCR